MLFNAIRLCSNCSLNYRTSRNKRLQVELTLIELSQMSDSDSDDGGGRRPKMLKPIFNKIAQEAQQAPAVAQQRTDGSVGNTQTRDTAITSSPIAVPQNRTAPATKADAPDRTTQATAKPAPAIQGRPAELRTRAEGGGTLGMMFKKSRTNIAAGTQENTQLEEPCNNKEIATTAAIQENNTGTTTTITDAALSQAWTSFALLLPENERALADRMKIISPKVDDQSSFTISVDNQMAADLFYKEEKRICEGMKTFLGNATMKMKVVVNKVVVERHVSDKSKQYAILVEKNPLVERLRKELNLEIAR